jgi:hypothetical protein
VLIGLDVIKFSGSINKLGKKNTKNIQTKNIRINPIKSLEEKY